MWDWWYYLMDNIIFLIFIGALGFGFFLGRMYEREQR